MLLGRIPYLIDFGTIAYSRDNPIWVIRCYHRDHVLLRDKSILAMMCYLDDALLGDKG